jgi:hypothetical protein
MGASINQRGEATASYSSVEEDGGGRDEEDSIPPLVTSGARIGCPPGQEVVQEQATTRLAVDGIHSALCQRPIVLRLSDY